MSGVDARSPERERIATFAGFLALVAITSLAYGVALFAAAFELLEDTGSARAFGLVAAGSCVPVGLLSPAVGRLIDRVPPMRILPLTGLLVVLGAAGLASMIATSSVTAIGAFFALSSIVVGYSAQTIAATPYAMRLASPRWLPRANALTHLLGAGPRLAGTVLASFAYAGGYGAAVLSTVAVATMLATVVSAMGRWPLGQWHEASTPAHHEDGALLVTWRAFRKTPVLMAVVGLLATRRLVMGGFDVLVAPMVLGGGTAETVGVVMAAGTAGFVVAGVGLSLVRVRSPGGWVLATGCVMALAVLTAATFASVHAVLLLATCSMFAAELALATTADSLWQRYVRGPLLGRTSAIRNVLAGLGAVAGSAFAGAAVEPLIGATALTTAGSAAVLLAGFGGLLALAVLPVAWFLRGRQQIG